MNKSIISAIDAISYKFRRFFIYFLRSINHHQCVCETHLVEKSTFLQSGMVNWNLFDSFPIDLKTASDSAVIFCILVDTSK